MQRHFTFLFFGLLGLGLFAGPAFAQNTADYYAQRQPSAQAYDRLVVRYGSFLKPRWYVGVEGFLRGDISRTDNSLNRLISADGITRPGFSVLVGWSTRDRWAIEGGYARTAIHNNFMVGNRSYPYQFTFSNERQGFFLRGKWQVLSTSPQWRRSGFWLTAGAWLIPNTGVSAGGFALERLAYHGAQEAPDTVRLVSQSTTNRRPTAMLELGAEYNIRVSSRVDLGFFVRRNWGLGTSIQTNVDYTVSDFLPRQTVVSSNGAGVSAGVTLRYTLSKLSKPGPSLGIYQLRGNGTR